MFLVDVVDAFDPNYGFLTGLNLNIFFQKNWFIYLFIHEKIGMIAGG